MDKSLDEIEFTIFDTETTGLEPQSGDRIVEIAAVRFKAAERLGEFQTLVNPHRPVSQAAFEVNKISAEMLKGAPDISEVIPKFIEFFKGSCLCSYNAGFDLEFLNNEIRLSGVSAALDDVIVVDVLRMARRLMPGLERYSLKFVSEKLRIGQEQLHRAFSDVELTLSVFNKLKETMLSKGISGFMNFSSLFSINRSFLESVNAQKLAEIQEAINLGVKLKIKYLSSTSKVSEREVIPRQIKQENNRSYLVGLCCLKNEERTFRVDGILHLEIV